MIRVWNGFQGFVGWLRRSPGELVSVGLVAIGLWLGVAVHKGFLILMAMGAFGPNVLRQLRLLDDLDEFQDEAASRAGLRAFAMADRRHGLARRVFFRPGMRACRVAAAASGRQARCAVEADATARHRARQESPSLVGKST